MSSTSCTASTSRSMRVMRVASSFRSASSLPLTSLPRYVRSLKPLGSSKENDVRSSTLTVEAAAVETSASKSKREKRLFRLNVPTATRTRPPKEQGADAGTMVRQETKVRLPRGYD